MACAIPLLTLYLSTYLATINMGDCNKYPNQIVQSPRINIYKAGYGIKLSYFVPDIICSLEESGEKNNTDVALHYHAYDADYAYFRDCSFQDVYDVVHASKVQTIGILTSV